MHRALRRMLRTRPVRRNLGDYPVEVAPPRTVRPEGMRAPFTRSIAAIGSGLACLLGPLTAVVTGPLPHAAASERAASTQQQELTAGDAAPGKQLGASVALSGNGSTAVVGSCGAPPPGVCTGTQGAVYIFIKSGNSWIQQQELTASDGAANDAFGRSVAVSEDGNTVLVGAFNKTVGVNPFNGAAYVFTRNGTTWTQQAELTPTPGGIDLSFGESVSLSADGNTALVGSASGFQAAFVFIRIGSIWTQQVELNPSDGAIGLAFGRSVSLSADGNTALVGAYPNPSSNIGAAYVFTRSGTTWTQQQKLTASDGASGDLFGFGSLSGDGNQALIGAPGKNSMTGVAYVFTRSGTTWTQQQELMANDGAGGDFFGAGGGSLNADGTTALISALGKNSLTGVVYVFALTGSTWTQQQELTPGDGASGDFFGNSTSIGDAGGCTALIGAPNHNSRAGSAYVFANYSPCSAGTGGQATPSAPVDLVGADGPITLNWDPPVSSGTAPVTSYELFRFTSNTSAALVATVAAPTTTYVDSNVIPGVTYSYYVEALNIYGSSPPSNVVSITPTSAAAPPPPSSSCSGATGNAAFICALYQDILGRVADQAGLLSWQAAMSSGASPTQIAYGMATSTEYQTDFIEADYEAFLGRAADPGGLSTWHSAFNLGATDEQVDAGILGSAEFFSDAGGVNSGFINSVYQDLLGRPADSTGLATWNQALADGLSRTQVAFYIDTSNESRTDTVQFFYQTLLNRPADPGGLSTWVGALDSGATDEQVLAAIAGSPEFYSDATSA